ncbi:hypothetical protein T484DRAFT_1787445 [Baffinella frigidus]|nr:hypothetical protein T484DRAFT_1787445 [Cryptophyta sp. CCMP2293]
MRDWPADRLYTEDDFGVAVDLGVEERVVGVVVVQEAAALEVEDSVVRVPAPDRRDDHVEAAEASNRSRMGCCPRALLHREVERLRPSARDKGGERERVWSARREEDAGEEERAARPHYKEVRHRGLAGSVRPFFDGRGGLGGAKRGRSSGERGRRGAGNMVMQMLQTARNDSPGRKARRRGGDSESSGESGGGEGGRQGGGGNSAPGSGSDRDSGASSSDGEDAENGATHEKTRTRTRRGCQEWGDTRDDEEEEEEGMSVGSEDASVLQGRGKGEEARWKERYWEDGLPPLKTLDFQRRVLNREKKRKEARRDPLSASVHHAAEYYNSSEVTRLLQVARAEKKVGPGEPLWAARVEKKVGPGEPLWVTLPGGKERVDAGKISPGELIEAVLTNGMMLKRDEFGRVLPIKGMPRLVRRVEPLRSLLSRRVERGVDVYADGTPPPYDDEDDEKPPTGTDDEYWEEKVSPKQWWNQCRT